jgi:hypothetical protein
MEIALGPVSRRTGNGLPSAGMAVNQMTGLYSTNAANFLGGFNPNIGIMLAEQFGNLLGGCIVPADSNGFWTLNAADFGHAYINCDAGPGPLDQYGPFCAPLYPKNYFPGIPATTEADFGNNWDEFAVSFMGYVFLNSGTNIFNVNSDDGFILFVSPSPNPNDLASLVMAGEYAYSRGASTTVMPVVIVQSGWYSVRLDYFQGAGQTECAFFSSDANGNDILINDTTSPTALLAYPTPEIYPTPYAVAFSPANGSTGFAPRTPPDVTVAIQDGSLARIDSAKPVTAQMFGTNLIGLALSTAPSFTPSGQPMGNLTTISASPPPGLLLPGGSVIPIEVDFTDTEGNPVAVTWSFMTSGTPLVYDNATINTNKPGFIVYPFQETGPFTNDVSGENEEQILGITGPNIARNANWPDSESGLVKNALPGPQGFYFIETNYINWNIASAEAGDDFDAKNGYPPNEFPGIVGGAYPGEAGLPANATNFQMLVETWLFLPTADIYLLGVNSDDGFSLKSGVAPADVFGTLLGAFEGGRASADTLIAVVAPAAGFYPMRLLYQQGGGGAECEFYSVAGDGTNSIRQLVNDSTNAIKAYYSAGFYWPCVGGVSPPIGQTGVDPATPLVVQLVDGMINYQPDAVTSVQIYTNGSLATGLVSTRANGGTTVQFGSPQSQAFAAGSNFVMVVYTDANNILYTNSWSFSTATPPSALRHRAQPGGPLTLTWTGPGTLQRAERLTGRASDWTDIPGIAAKTYTEPANERSAAFFKLRP